MNIFFKKPFLIADIGYENNNSLIQIILFGEKDSNEGGGDIGIGFVDRA